MKTDTAINVLRKLTGYDENTSSVMIDMDFKVETEQFVNCTCNYNYSQFVSDVDRRQC